MIDWFILTLLAWVYAWGAAVTYFWCFPVPDEERTLMEWVCILGWPITVPAAVIYANLIA